MAHEESGTLPHWDVSGVFPGLDSPEFEKEFARLKEEASAIRTLFEERSIRGEQSPPPDAAPAALLDDVLVRYNAFREDLETVESFIYAFFAVDSRDQRAQAKLSEMKMLEVEAEKIKLRLEAWVGTLDVNALVEKSEVARAHEFALRRARTSAEHQMSEAEEDLAAGLSVSGSKAWELLHSNLSSQLEVEVELPDGATKVLPMSAVRGMAHDPDEPTRRAAYEAELKAWERVSVPLAASLNGVKGEMNVLNSRREWPDALAESLHRNNIERSTLEAMHAACVESFPDMRRYLSAKAKLLGKKALPWWDLFAPVGDAETAKLWPYKEGSQFIVDQFGSYSEKMAGLARRAFEENWIDAEPRLGKTNGAFCMHLRKGESRILSNYETSFDSVHTLAHELGHAYHNFNLAERTFIQQQTPMALAETASIFCQTIITNAVLDVSEGMDELRILEADLQDACQVVVDIHSRFLFESEVFKRREARDLSVDEFNEQMLEAQRATYGDGLDQEYLHQYMWAVKGHYYGSSFYNYPYTFGLLFGLGLFAQYRQDPDKLRAGYDDLLSSTGLANAADLARRFGLEIDSFDFWKSSLDLISERVDRFEKAAEAHTS
ncbi:MAG TPA: M3 family oligoendopeptidase [Actinomycetota bacterium]|nr:M3 family oligoendopeptidase [Actinomycetota bacterium]